MEYFPWPSKHLVLSVGVSLSSSMSRRKTGGLCGCLQGKDEPPEITYQVVESGGVVSLQPVVLTPTQPMPDEEELNAKFAELVDELDLTGAKKEVMFSLPAQKKWQLYLSKKLEMEETSAHCPDYYIDKVKSMANLLTPRDDKDVKSRSDVLDNLKTALRTQPNSFVLRFLERDGLSALLRFLGAMEYEMSESPVHTSLIGCIKALMNNSGGRAHVLAHSTAMATVAQSLSCRCVKTKVAVLEILGAVCLVPGGHKKVLTAALHYQKYAGERTRFQTIVNDLARTTGAYCEDLNLKTAIMSFVNAVLNYGPGEDHLEFRLHLRYEFLMLGIQPAIDKLRSHENATLDRHLDIFEMVRNEDEKELARRFDMVHVETKSASSMFDLLRRKLSHTAAYPHLLSLLQHSLMLPLDYGACPQHWLLFDRLVQQIVLQGDNGKDPDVPSLDINVKEIVKLLATEEEITEARERAVALEKEHSDLVSKVAKRELEIEKFTQEKEDLASQLSKIKGRLEKESVAHLEAQQKIEELEYRVADAQRLLEVERQQRSQAESLAKAASLCDDAKVGLGVSSASPGTARAPSATGPGAPCRAQMPPPPPPPPVPSHLLGSAAGAPPPPPPPPMIMTNGIGPAPPAPPVSSRVVKKKTVPQPSNPLKSFNWSKLPESKVDGTVWLELDDSKLYKDIDLYDFDRTFSAYQKQQALVGSSEDIPSALQSSQPNQQLTVGGTGTKGSNANLNGNRTRELTVIDGRRAQNCTILLSKLRLSNEDICTAILTMDTKDLIPKDMVEQLLKFMPSTEEVATLEEHSTEIESMARADKFLYEMSRIVHYEQRLRTLFYKKKFQERVADCKPKIEAVLEASKEVKRSKRLKKLLELILALGNYMNRGQRGNALGFHLASLNRIADTKSSVARNLTLLHFLVDTLDKKFKDTLKLEGDIPHVRQASKVNLTELKNEMKLLRSGMEEIQRELEFHRSCTSEPRDKFSPVMKDFLAHAMFKMSDLEESFQDMNGMYEKCLRHFGEDPASQQQPDEFFGIFDSFLTSFNEARQESEAIRKKKEADEERRRARHNRILDAAAAAADSIDQSKREKGLNGFHGSNGSLNGLRTISGGTNHSTNGKGEFDDLICALRTGDVFSEDLAKFRRNRRRAHHGTGGSSTLPAGEGWGTRNGGVRETSRERVNTPPPPPPKVKG